MRGVRARDKDTRDSGARIYNKRAQGKDKDDEIKGK